jgi:hypothetical protein
MIALKPFDLEDKDIIEFTVLTEKGGKEVKV